MLSKLNAIVMTYNSEKFIERCLKSLFDRVGRVIIVDSRFKGYEGKYNHSTDDTILIVNDISKNTETDVVVFSYPDDREPLYEYEMRSVAIELVPDGEWLMFVDSDEEIVTWHEKHIVLDDTRWKIGGADERGILCRKVPELRYTVNPHYGLRDANGEIDWNHIIPCPAFYVAHQPAVKSMKPYEHVRYLNWLWQNPVSGDRLDYKQVIKDLNWEVNYGGNL